MKKYEQIERMSNEKYKRMIKLLFSSVMLLGLCGIYAFVWIGYYNKYIVQSGFGFFRRGNWLMVLLYGVLLTFFMKTYGGFKVGYLKNGNLIYSQIISVVFTNLFTYFQIAVIDKRFVGPAYIVIMTIVDIALIVFWTQTFQTLYKNIFPPRKMVLISGEREDYHLRNKINSREDKYEICKTISCKNELSIISREIEEYDGVIIGDIPSHERNVLLKFCYEKGIRSYSVPKISDILLRSSVELNLFDSPLLLSRNTGLTVEQSFFKRFEDIVVAFIMLIIFSPVFLITAACIKLTDHGPIFYKQDRLTQGGKVFQIYKFRTMVLNAEESSGPVLAEENDPRITKIGRFLRRLRLDEAPQILNILKGDMSVVGPRPERPELAAQICEEIPEFEYRLKVKAGLTGYAQVYGKYNTTSYDKLKLDLTYIRNFSFLLDFKLILMTPKIMLIKESTEGVKSRNNKHN